MAAKRKLGDDYNDDADGADAKHLSSEGWKRKGRCPECGCEKLLLTRPGPDGPRQWTSGPGAQCRKSLSSATGAHCANRTPEAYRMHTRDPRRLYELPFTDGWQNKFELLKNASAEIKTTVLQTVSLGVHLSTILKASTPPLTILFNWMCNRFVPSLFGLWSFVVVVVHLHKNL